MEYNWDSQDFYKRIQKATTIVENEDNFEKKFYGLYLIDEMNALYYNYFFAQRQENESNENLFNNCVYSLINYDRYVPFITSSFETFKAYNTKVDKIQKFFKKNIKKLEERKKIQISHEEKLILMYDFFKQLDPELFTFFQKIYETRKTNICFVNSKAHVGRSDCLSLAIVNESFLTICDDNSIDVFPNLAHECGHAVSFLMNPTVSYNQNKDFLIEVESFFFELLSIDYFSKLFNNKDFIIYQQELYSTMMTIGEALTTQELIVQTYLKNERKCNHNFFKTLEQKLNITKNIYYNSIQADFEHDGTYLLSFLTALELYHLYKTDKELALDYFKQIINCPSEKNRFVLANQYLNLGKNLDLYGKKTLANYTLELKRRATK